MEATETKAKEKPKRNTKRRGNGEGSIYQQADGRWCARVTIGRSDKGKRRVKAVYAWTKADVQKKLTKILTQKQDGTLCHSGRVTVGEFLDQWLDSLSKQRTSTIASYRQIIKKHVKPYVGGVQLGILSPSNVNALYTSLREAKKSPRLVQMVHTVLRRALSRAVIEGSIPRNVCAAVERPSSEKPEMQCLSVEQAKSFLAAAEFDRLHALYVLAIYGGLRQGELFGLRRDDLDLDKGAVTVRRTLVELNGKFLVNPPKSKKGTRRIQLPDAAVAALRDHLKRRLVEGNAGAEYLFCDRDGGPLRRQNVLRRSFRPILEKAELPIIRFHDLRHTSATLLLAQKVHPKIVQERLGHSQIAITLDTYSHVLEGMDAEAADKIGDVLSGPLSEIA